jgi:hypothetical protein
MIGPSAGGSGGFDDEGVPRADEAGVEVRKAEDGAAPPRFEPRKKRGLGAAISARTAQFSEASEVDKVNLFCVELL